MGPTATTEAPIDVGTLTTEQLIAVIENDAETYAKAGEVVVPEALAALRARVTDDEAQEYLKEHQLVADAADAQDEKDEEQDEQAAAKAEEDQQKRHEAAVEALKRPMGGMPVSKLCVQITGGGGAGALELPASAAGIFERDREVRVTLKGWIKTGKETTQNKGGAGVREMVMVIEELESFEDATSQMQIGD